MPCALLSSSRSTLRRRPAWRSSRSGIVRRSSRLARARAVSSRLALRDIDLVVVERVQRRRGRRRHPGGVGAGLRGGAIFCSSISAIRSGGAHMPLPICALPGKPAGEPDVDVAVLVGLDPRRARFISSLRSTGPASIEVWISSPVRSRKPVLMKNTRDFAARMHALRLTVVRRSSSMMPILMRVARQPEQVLDRRRRARRRRRPRPARASSASRCRSSRCGELRARPCAAGRAARQRR